jgi:hypothetical protein
MSQLEPIHKRGRYLLPLVLEAYFVSVWGAGVKDRSVVVFLWEAFCFTSLVSLNFHLTNLKNQGGREEYCKARMLN